jgi:hypothetical protein
MYFLKKLQSLIEITCKFRQLSNLLNTENRIFKIKIYILEPLGLCRSGLPFFNNSWYKKVNFVAVVVICTSPRLQLSL